MVDLPLIHRQSEDRKELLVKVVLFTPLADDGDTSPYLSDDACCSPRILLSVPGEILVSKEWHRYGSADSASARPRQR